MKNDDKQNDEPESPADAKRRPHQDKVGVTKVLPQNRVEVILRMRKCEEDR